MDVAAFRRFLAVLPVEERWELVAGTPHRVPAPTILHQRILSNLDGALDASLRRARPGLIPIRRPGLDLRLGRLDLPGLGPADLYDPSPDLAVVTVGPPHDARHAPAAFLVAEVRHRDGDGPCLPVGPPWREAKIALYRAHAACTAVIDLDADLRTATVHRRASGGWTSGTIGEDDALDLPDFGLRVTLARLLEPRHATAAPAV